MREACMRGMRTAERNNKDLSHYGYCQSGFSQPQTDKKEKSAWRLETVGAAKMKCESNLVPS